MTSARLLGRSLLYHWRGNLAVLLGVIVSAAVLTGALLVGDSLHGSLADLTQARLGWVDYALVPGRFFRAELADKLRAQRVSPVLMLPGAASSRDSSFRGQKVVLYGVDERFWPEGDPASRLTPAARPDEAGEPQVMVSAALAGDLHLRVGDQVSFHLQKAGSVPRETVLGRRKAEDVLADFTLTVAAVLPEDHFGSRFRLTPGPAAPHNAFVSLSALQAKLRRQDKTLPDHPVNALLLQGGEPEEWQADLKRYMTLEDYGLVLRKPRPWKGRPAPKYLSLESRQLFLKGNLVRVVRDAKLTAAPTLAYLVNNVSVARRQAATAAALLAPPGSLPLARPAAAYAGPLEASYAVVAALEPDRRPPLGPFLPQGIRKLSDEEIVLVRWEGSPFAQAKPGEVVTLTYFEPQQEGQLHERTAAFKLAGFLPLTGAADDPNLTPQFPGITDKLTLGDWDPPFPFDRSRIKPADEDYWTAHRTTPKAYLTLKAGERLWASRFGRYTSVRIAGHGQSVEEIGRRLLAKLHPRLAGMAFQDVRQRGLEASTGGADFGLLFLGFSSFLIAAALLLVGLLFRLNLDRRAAEVGLLLATGFRRGQVRRLLLFEGGLLAVVGAALGCAAAVLYAWAMLTYLGARWPGGLDRAFLQLHITLTSLVIGFAGAVAMSVLTIFWASRVLSSIAPSALLAGSTIAPQPSRWRRPLWTYWLAALSTGGALAFLVIGAGATNHEMQAGSFFGSGALALIALLALIWAWLRVPRRGQTATSLAGLGVRNAGRHPLRSLLTVGLLASATFLVVAVQVFHKAPDQDFLAKTGGSGGFALLGESDLPIYQDLNSPRGREELDLPAATVALLQNTRTIIYPLRLGPGDDASCLNLYRPLQPRLLGAPPSLIERGGFRFMATEATTDAERQNPWLLLRKKLPDSAVPVFGDATTVTWMLKSGLGQELTVTDEDGYPVRLRIVGLFEDSIFQSELVAAEENFLKRLYRRQEGYRLFLIATPPAEAPQVQAALNSGLAAYGFTATPTAERLASYLAVENTYLATFQALGGLGLLLGALGLAVVLVRSIWERRGELALLRAMGFRRSALGWLVLVENACLLVLGLVVGAAAALVAVMPHLTAGVLWLHLIGLLAAVLLVGLAAGAAAVAATLRAPLLPALRRE
jgi:putative ABC transport system permease protein